MDKINELLGYTPNSAQVETITFEDNQKSNKPSWQLLQSGDKKAASAFLQEMEPTINKAIHLYAADDGQYKTQARLLSLKAAESFDPNRGADIKTHVFNNLKRLQRISAQRGNFTKIPENASLQLGVINRAIKDYEIDHNDTPTVDDIADITGFSRERIDSLSHYKPVLPDSITTSPEGDNLTESRVKRGIDLYNKYIYNDLDKIDKKIYEWSTGYGLNKKLSGKEIADRLKISPAAVSKRYTNIAKKFARDREILQEMYQ